MKFKVKRRVPLYGGSLATKTLLIMKLSIVMLIATCVQVQAKGFAQKVSLNEKNAPLEKVFKLIRKQTGFYIFYKDEVLKQAGNPSIDIQVRDVSVEEALNRCLSNLPLTYSIIDRTIIVKPKIQPPAAVAAPAPLAQITGIVKDEKGNPMAGVSVKNKRTGRGTSTNAEGKFTIAADLNDVLEITYVGYQAQQVTITSLQPVDIALKLSVAELESTVIVAYGAQKRKALTSAVSSVSNQEIVTTKNENVQNMLTGKVAGLNVIQNTSEPGSFDNSFNIRSLGDPLVVIDGVPRDNITRLDPNDIESISVLKDASAAMYGVRAANGVVLITTKKGKKGTLALSYSGNMGFQFPSGMPKPLDAIGYMTLVNQQALHNVNGGTLVYKQADFDAYRTGAKKSYDWYNAAVAKSFPQTQHNLSASGGNDNTTYFLSLGYTYQDGLLKSGDLNYKRYNIRSNISSKLTKNISLDLNVNGILDTKNQPWSDAWWIIRSIWRQNPLDPFYANDDPDHLFQGSVDGTNPIALSGSGTTGYKVFNNRWFQSSIAFTYKIPFVPGLSAKALYSYDYKISDNKFFQKEYNQYTYNAANSTYTKFIQNSPSTIRREYFSLPATLSQVSLNYDQTFNGAHSVNALVLYEESVRQSDNFYASRQLALPVDQLLAGNALNQQANMDPAQLYKYANRALVGRLNYAFRSKYLAEFSFRYDGSSKFEKSKQWGFFPAVSAGWRISDERFWQNIAALSFVNSLKLRASYGKLGDDAASTYQFITGYLYPATGDNNRLPPGSVFDGNFVNSLQSRPIPNPNITWYVSKTFDAGIDAEAWNGLLGVTVDVFSRNRSGLLDYRTLSLPAVIGADLPQENLNSDQARGFDLEINHRNHIGRVNYFVKGILAYSRTESRHKEQARAGNSYLNWYNNNNAGNLNNRYNGVYWGFGDAGRYQSFNDIYNSEVALGRNTLPGDYMLEDWNGDGEINDLDIHPIGYSGNPLVTYGITIGGSFKGFDLNMLFQGSAKANVAYFEQLNTPLWGSNRSSALSQFMDNYHPVDPTADPYDPNTVWTSGHFPYTGTVPPTNSAANMQNGAYLRLKTIELGYSIPSNILSTIGVKAVRVYVNGYNVFTITKLKYVDPEHPSSTYGYLYPLNKSVSGGIVVNF